MSETVEQKIEQALAKHRTGYNCAQSVSCVFCDHADIDELTMFRMTEGLGLGMGGMEGTCGAISSAAVLAGLKNSTANLSAPDSKGTSYKASKQCLNAFMDQNGSVVCKELKGVDTGHVLRSCNDCIADAVRIIAQKLYGEE